MVHHSGVLMMTYWTTKLLAVGDEAGANVVHDLDLNVHSKMELPEHFIFSPNSGRSITVVKLVLLSAGLEPLDASVVNPDQTHALLSLGVNDPVIHFLHLLGPVVEAWWGYPGSNPWFWGAGWHCQRAEFGSEHDGAKRYETWGIVFPLGTVMLQHLLESLHVLNDGLSLVISSNVIYPCDNYHL